MYKAKKSNIFFSEAHCNTCEFALSINLSVSQYWENRFFAFSSFLNNGKASIFLFPVGRESCFEVVFVFLVGLESCFEAVFMFLVGR